MAKEKKQIKNESDERLNELKVQLLTQNSKRKVIKKEIARILTLKNSKGLQTEKNIKESKENSMKTKEDKNTKKI
jgi:ribosomal protein L29